VWLIFVVVLLWTCFPTVFAVVMSTLYIPLTLAALGIIARGSSFAYRKVTEQPGLRQLFGGLFALSSVLTPFFSARSPAPLPSAACRWAWQSVTRSRAGQGPVRCSAACSPYWRVRIWRLCTCAPTPFVSANPRWLRRFGRAPLPPAWLYSMSSRHVPGTGTGARTE
jgi:hypothetical protein